MLETRSTIEDPPAWLFTVARRVVGKIAAQHKNRAEGEPQELLHTGAAQWTSLTARASTDDVAEAREVLARLAELPDHQKTSAYLRHVHGWSAAEIGDYLKCAPTTANVHIHRGKQRLRIAMAVVGFFLVSNLMMMKPWEPGSGDHTPWPDSAGHPTLLGIILMATIFLSFVISIVIFGVLPAVRLRRAERHVIPGEQAAGEDD